MTSHKGDRHYDRAFDHREALELHADGLSYSHLAAIYGVTASAIKMAIYRSKLRHAEKAPPAAACTIVQNTTPDDESEADRHVPARVSDGHAWARCDRCTTAARVPRGATLPRHWARDYTIKGARDLCPDCQRAKRLMPWLAA